MKRKLQVTKTFASLEEYKKAHPVVNTRPRSEQDMVRFAEEASKKSVQIEKGTGRER